MDIKEYLTAVLALIFVLGLILMATHFAKRAGFGAAIPGRRGRKRLSVTESVMIDGKRRLLLVRRDATEHLLLIGGTTDLVIETGLTPPAESAPAEGDRM